MRSRVLAAGIFTLLLSTATFTFAQTGDVPPDNTTGIYCPALTRDLWFGLNDSNTGGQVTELQTFFASYYDDYPEDYITGRFRTKTREFAIRFQKEHNLTPAVGYVGPKTRAVIARVCATPSLNASNSNTSTSNTGSTSLPGGSAPSPGPNGNNGQTNTVGCPGTGSDPCTTQNDTPPQNTLNAAPTSGALPLTVTINPPSDVSAKMRSCIYSLGFFGPSGNGLTVDWGDGTSDPRMTDANRDQSCTNAVTTHTYTTPGTYVISVTSWHPGPTDAPMIDWQGSATITAGSGVSSCVPHSPQTQTIQCPPEQTGAMTQTRTSSCPGPSWSQWVTTASTCANTNTQNN